MSRQVKDGRKSPSLSRNAGVSVVHSLASFSNLASRKTLRTRRTPRRILHRYTRVGFFLGVTLALLARTASGQTVTWLGGTGQWSQVSAWNCLCVPNGAGLTV